MPAVTLRDELHELGSAVYVRTAAGPRVATAAALTVNAAAEAIDYRALTARTAADAIAQLLDSPPHQDRSVVFVGADDSALDAVARLQPHAAALRKGADGSTVQLRWLDRRPAPDTAPTRFVTSLVTRELLYEPLQRIARLMRTPAERISATTMAPPLDAYLREHGVVDWPHAFLPYQLDGIRALIERPHILLADDMGLGKTVQAAAALRILIRTAAIDNALVVAPASILGQWYRALKLWTPELRVSAIVGNDRAWRWRTDAHVYLVSFETLRSDFSENPESGPRRRSWGVVLLDEAQKIKNRDVDAARACKRLARERSWALTGTPLENQVDDLRSICEFLVASESAARDLADTQQLCAVHAQLQLRRRKRDVLTQLPPKTVIEVPVQLGARQRASYEKARQEGVVWLRQLGGAVTITHVLELILRLKQICNFCPESGESAKFDDLRDRLDQLVAEGNRALLFTQFTDEQFGVAALAQRLARHRPITYTGSHSQDEKEDALRQFRTATDARPLILSLRAGGLGLNLQEASYVFHFDRWWNPAVEHQAEDRSHRMGQSRPVTVYAYVCEDTIEVRIQEILAAKGALFRDWIDDVGVQRRGSLTEEEIFGLVGLDAPRQTPPTISESAQRA